MSRRNFRRDLKTDWAGKFKVEYFRITADSPTTIETSGGTYTLEIEPADADIQNGAYIYINFKQEKGIGMAYLSCDGTRQLQIVDILDSSSNVFTARTYLHNKVLSFDVLLTETGPPRSSSDPAIVLIGTAERIE